ncbi:hypothetical protein FXB39_01640 [Nocardioides sp. BGMRC 2183]|nr:hypothetical protein FXB39_01640 [Nocardioides sp. BGMRC 2183]
MRRPWLLLRGCMALLLLAALMSSATSSQAEDQWYPGLPEATFGNWVNAAQGGMSYAKRAQQWFVSPMGMTTAEVYIEQNPDNYNHKWVRAAGYFISPKGAPANYGYLEPMKVRSVGFGLMPVEATIRISQRFADGYPVPVRVKLAMINEFRQRPPGDPTPGMIQDRAFLESTISDRFNVEIIDVKVDGVDLQLDGNCRTVKPAPVTLVSPAFRIEDVTRYPTYQDDWFRAHDPSTYYHPQYGGELKGTMTIPPFTGCTTAAGDDLSDLLTLSASGPDNTVLARTGWPCPYVKNGANAPAPPGVSNPGLGSGHAPSKELDPRYCPGVKAFDYPDRTAD